MNRIELTIRHKLFHHDQTDPLGIMMATTEGTKIKFGKPSFTPAIEKLPDGILRQFRKTIRGHVVEFLKDTRYCILWNEETGFETTCKLL